MQKIKLKDVASRRTFGANAKDVLHKAILMAIDVKSIRSSVTMDEAQKYLMPCFTINI
ncbi:MAG: hypothetical protein Q9M40_10895 [Sulfurimonas sp.]|nr:hypothetical protein [Sulfurimonas sp.]